MIHLEILNHISSIWTSNYASILINVLSYGLLVLVMDIGAYSLMYLYAFFENFTLRHFKLYQQYNDIKLIHYSAAPLFLTSLGQMYYFCILINVLGYALLVLIMDIGSY